MLLTGNTHISYLPCNIYLYMYLNACKASITSFCMSKTGTDKAKHLCMGNMFKACYTVYCKNATEAVKWITFKGVGIEDIKNDCTVPHFMLSSVAVVIKSIGVGSLIFRGRYKFSKDKNFYLWFLCHLSPLLMQYFQLSFIKRGSLLLNHVKQFLFYWFSIYKNMCSLIAYSYFRVVTLVNWRSQLETSVWDGRIWVGTCRLTVSAVLAAPNHCWVASFLWKMSSLFAARSVPKLPPKFDL